MQDKSWEDRAKVLGILENDLVEQFIRGSGSGGQKINKTSSTVLLRHLPSGIEIRCQATRSQATNRDLARQWLCDSLEAKNRQTRDNERQEMEKSKRRTRPKPRSLKRKQIEQKRRRSIIKKDRRNWDADS